MHVELNASVNLILSAYAMSNEYQEIAAILLGTKTDSVVRISNCTLLRRKDKKSDRVEISDGQLLIALQEAEDLKLKVVGWVHSHPKITVLPSHVDLKTQFGFQSMDSHFIGLIYSCFHQEQSSEKLQVIAFQTASVDGKLEQINLPLKIINEAGIKDLEIFQKLDSIANTYYEEDLEMNTGSNEIDYSTLALNILKTKNAFIDPLLLCLSSHQ
jgi:BRCA1/BRCA2-containing complex subunit 3